MTGYYLNAKIPNHDSSLGPAIGGVRYWNYPSEDALIKDAIRSAESASLTAALCGCDAGGGKAILWGDPSQKNERMFRALGRYIQGLGGRFIAAIDLGTTVDDIAAIQKETEFVVCGSLIGESECDYSSITARGVYLGIKAACKTVFGSSSLAGKKISIQGIGKVGFSLLELLHKEKAELYVSDVFFEKVKAAKDAYPDVILVKPAELQALEVDIFSPCAFGDVIGLETVKKLRCKMIAGSANNQLVSEDIADFLDDSGILFLPDFLINSGETITINDALYQIPKVRSQERVEQIYDLVEELLLKAREEKRPPYHIAKDNALKRMREIRSLKKIHLSNN
ncbi:leucine dehydrogenase [bacterium]|nr:leucine dehydrogenase [bacterium]